MADLESMALKELGLVPAGFDKTSECSILITMKILIKIIKIEFHICSDVLKVDLNLVISIIQCNFFIFVPFSG